MEVELKTQEKERNILEFTGNWFFDLGILGFVNLMEEVYDWNLEELRRKIDEDKETIFYYYFPFAYLFYHSKAIEFNMDLRNIIRKKKLPNKDDLIKRLKENFSTEKKDFINSLEKNLKIIRDDSESLFKNSKDLIKSMIKNFKIHAGGSGRNFYLYNPKKPLFESFIYLHYLIKEDFKSLKKVKKLKGGKEEALSYELKPDVVINPFIFSNKILNLSYTALPDIYYYKKALNVSIPFYILLLSIYSHGFINIISRNISFYTPNLEITYSINKKIRTEKNRIKDRNSLLKVTFLSLVDEIVERKAKFSLEEMYIIEYKSVKNQQIAGVEYIGITKLRAKILSDDNIRDKLNTILKIRRGKNDKDLEDVWVLEELIKHKPLFPIVMNHINYIITNLVKVKNQKKKLQFSPKSNLLYALSTDLVLGGIEKENKGESVFSEEFFEKYSDVCEEIKRTKRNLSYIGSLVSNIFRKINNDERTKLISSLFSILIKGNRSSFVNTLLKQILNQNLEEKNSNFFDLMIKFILNNDEGWRHYALSIIIGLTYSGGEENND